MVWSKAGAGGWEGSKEEGPDGIPSKVGQGHRAIAATAGWCDPEQVVSLTLVFHSADVEGERAAGLGIPGSHRAHSPGGHLFPA